MLYAIQGNREEVFFFDSARRNLDFQLAFKKIQAIQT